MKRMGRVISIKTDDIQEYKRLHASVWPEVLKCLTESNITNYSVFLREQENLLFSYWEYVGDDFEADRLIMSQNQKFKEWWNICGPMQEPFESRADGEWWASMEEVFHLS